MSQLLLVISSPMLLAPFQELQAALQKVSTPKRLEPAAHALL